jgi:hypothetical protein
MNRNFQIQASILFSILLANFAAQIIYFFHLYYSPQHPFPSIRSTLIMGSVFALFIAGFFLFITKHQTGYRLLVFYLLLEFLFYLWNIMTSGFRPGYGWFFHVREPDPILWIVFAIGCLNFFASGYFLVLLIFYRKNLYQQYNFEGQNE